MSVKLEYYTNYCITGNFEWFNLQKQVPAKHFEKIFTKMDGSSL